ncbi:MAG: hypothetical protein JW955_01805 [Sedimentisphaerales bacterium]|nr:hypothetical protein [Sedimentisphaerales bacterium]
METAVLIGVLVAAGLLVASGVWVGIVLIGAVARIRRPAVTEKLHPHRRDDSALSGPASDRT